MKVNCPHCGAERDVTGIPDNAVVYCACGKPFTVAVSNWQAPPQAGAQPSVPQSPVPQPPMGLPPQTSGMAIASLILSCLGFLFWIFTAIPGIILGFVAKKKIDNKPGIYTGRGLATAGIIVGFVTMFFSMGVILALIAIPNFIGLRGRAYDASAQSAGRNAKLAEEVYYNDKGGDISGSYTDNLPSLLAYDRNLADDPGVTFSFVSADKKGYTYTTKHKNGSQVYTFTD